MKHMLNVSLRLFGKLVIARIFGIVLSSTILVAFNGLIGSLITQFCSAVLLIVIVFASAWDIGSKDSNMIQIGQVKKDSWLGLKAGLLASVPEFCMALCLILAKAGVINEYFPVLFTLFNGSFLPFQQALISPTMTIAENPWFGYILVALTTLIAPICSGFGYRLGLMQVPLSDTLLYTTPEARQRHEERLKARRSRSGRRLFR